MLLLHTCVSDVVYMPLLYDKYNSKIRSVWRSRVSIETQNRLKLAQQHGFTGNSRAMAQPPVGW